MSISYHDSPNPTTRVCNKCRIEKPLTDFYHQARGRDGYKSICKMCCDPRNQVIFSDILIQLPLCFETKVCNDCLQEKPLDAFSLKKDAKDKHQNRCKDCQNERYRQSERGSKIAASKQKLLPQTPGHKICRKCLIEKPLSEFAANPTPKDKHATQCKECVAYRMYVVDREKNLARMKKHYKENKEHYREVQHKNYEENKERYKASVRQWQRENILHVREWYKRRRAQKRGTAVEPVDYEQILERDGMWCHICEQPIEEHHKLQFDHVIPLARNGTHTMENIRPAHDICNQRKYDKLMEELTSFDRRGPDC